jgi:hypothetical protein
MELSPSLESANCAVTQELPSILRNPKVHHHVHKSPTIFPILSQIDPIHTIQSYLSKIHLNIVHPPTSWSSYWSPSFWLPHHILNAFESQVRFLALRSVIQRISPCPRLLVNFRNKLIFYGEEMLAPSPTPKLEDHPLSAVRDCLLLVC